ncbi:hypothetical protein SLA2020_491080 [Shorea laevis]
MRQDSEKRCCLCIKWTVSHALHVSNRILIHHHLGLSNSAGMHRVNAIAQTKSVVVGQSPLVLGKQASPSDCILPFLEIISWFGRDDGRQA